MTRISYLFLTLLVLLLIPSCNSCSYPRDPESQEQQKKALPWYELSPEKANAFAPEYLYNSSLSFMINNNINTEIVTIQARHQNLYMTKKIDDSHFFEILQDNTQLFVKNRTGPWRSGASNKAKYLDLIHEGFNSLSWLINQASLEQILATKKPRWNITNEPLPEQAPLRTLIPDIKESLINAHIELESKQDSIKYADITINLSNTTTNIIIKLIINLSAHDAKNIPDTPTLAHEEGINIPVNIATRFKQLMDEAR